MVWLAWLMHCTDQTLRMAWSVWWQMARLRPDLRMTKTVNWSLVDAPVVPSEEYETGV